MKIRPGAAKMRFFENFLGDNKIGKLGKEEFVFNTFKGKGTSFSSKTFAFTLFCCCYYYFSFFLLFESYVINRLSIVLMRRKAFGKRLEKRKGEKGRIVFNRPQGPLGIYKALNFDTKPLPTG